MHSTVLIVVIIILVLVLLFQILVYAKVKGFAKPTALTASPMSAKNLTSKRCKSCKKHSS